MVRDRDLGDRPTNRTELKKRSLPDYSVRDWLEAIRHEECRLGWEHLSHSSPTRLTQQPTDDCDDVRDWTVAFNPPGLTRRHLQTS